MSTEIILMKRILKSLKNIEAAVSARKGKD
jgi:hypothetical protein